MAQVILRKQELKKNGLPEVCALCGEPAVVWRKKTAYWASPWLYLLIFSLLILLIVYFVTRRKVNFVMPFCEVHQNHWTKLPRTAWGSALGGLLGLCSCFMVLAIFEKNEAIGKPIAIVLLVISLLLLLYSICLSLYVGFTSVRVVGFVGTRVKVAGVCPAFEEALIEFRREQSETEDAPASPSDDSEEQEYLTDLE